MEDEDGPSALDVAVYARDIALNLEAMTARVGLIGLSALFRAAAWEAAESLKHVSEESHALMLQKAAAEDAA